MAAISAVSESNQCVVLSESQTLIQEVSKCGLSISTAKNPAEFLERAWSRSTEMIVLDGSGSTTKALVDQVSKLREAYKQTFICVFGEEAGRQGKTRIAVADVGAAMASWSVVAVRQAGERVRSSLQREEGDRTYSCPYCQKSGLTGDGLALHYPMYHLNEDDYRAACPICGDTPDASIRVSTCSVTVYSSVLGSVHYGN